MLCAYFVVLLAGLEKRSHCFRNCVSIQKNKKNNNCKKVTIYFDSYSLCVLNIFELML